MGLKCCCVFTSEKLKRSFAIFCHEKGHLESIDASRSRCSSSVRLHRLSISGVFEVCKCGCYRHYFSDTIQSKQPCIILFNEKNVRY